jgi:hypothetical protein
MKGVRSSRRKLDQHTSLKAMGRCAHLEYDRIPSRWYWNQYGKENFLITVPAITQALINTLLKKF